MKLDIMMSRVICSDDDIRYINCAKCGNYLSVPPITIVSNTPYCGRCSPPNGNKNDGATFFESFAKLMFFPCKNDKYGCSVQSPWKRVLAHESDCKFKLVECPALDCEEEIHSKDLIDHFNNDHEDLIMTTNELTFLKNAEDVNKLYKWNKHVLIIQAKTLQNNVFFRISSLSKYTTKTVNVKVSIKNQIRTLGCLNQLKIMEYTSQCPDFSETEKININAIRNVTFDFTCVLNFECKVETDKSGINNDNILTELECPVCYSHMKAPIFMCSNGHSLCSTCKPRLQRCPSCTTNLSNIRNFSLERIAELLNLNTCLTQLDADLTCFAAQLESCTWTGPYSEMFQHLLSSHNNRCIELKCPVFICLNDPIRKVEFLQYDQTIFKLYIDSGKTEPNVIGLAMECMQYFDDIDEKYMFYFDIIGDERVFNISEVCRIIPAASQTQNSVRYMNIPLLLLKPFIKENKLTFRLTIVKSR